MEVKINEGCIGCGLCEGTCPAVFRMGADGLAEAYGDADAAPETVREAASGCPVSVILIDD